MWITGVTLMVRPCSDQISVDHTQNQQSDPSWIRGNNKLFPVQFSDHFSLIRSTLFAGVLETMRRNCPQFVLKITLIRRDIATLLQRGSRFLQPINTGLCQLKTELLGKLAQS